MLGRGGVRPLAARARAGRLPRQRGPRRVRRRSSASASCAPSAGSPSTRRARSRAATSSRRTRPSPPARPFPRADAALLRRALEGSARPRGSSSASAATAGGTDEFFKMTYLGTALSSRVNGVSSCTATCRGGSRAASPGRSAPEMPIGSVTNGVHLPAWTARSAADPREGDGPDPGRALAAARAPPCGPVETVRLRVAAARRVAARPPRKSTRRGARRPDAPSRSGSRGASRPTSAPTSSSGIPRASRGSSRTRPGPSGSSSRARRIRATTRARSSCGASASVRAGRVPRPRRLPRGLRHRLARPLVQGVDVWLNNPRRPFEATGRRA